MALRCIFPAPPEGGAGFCVRLKRTMPDSTPTRLPAGSVLLFEMTLRIGCLPKIRRFPAGGP